METAYDPTATIDSSHVGQGNPVNIDPTVSPPMLKVDGVQSQLISLELESGETLMIDQQVHLYAQNSLLAHPLVSPALSYLGGLPPLLIIASDKEVLRDEIIYT